MNWTWIGVMVFYGAITVTLLLGGMGGMVMAFGLVTVMLMLHLQYMNLQENKRTRELLEAIAYWQQQTTVLPANTESPSEPIEFNTAGLVGHD